MLCVPSGPSEQPPVDLLSSFSIDPCAADILKLKCSEAFARILLLLQQQQQQIKKKKMTTMMKKKTSATNKKEFKQQKEEEEGEEEKAENTNSEEDKEEEKEAIERCCFKNFKTEGRYLHCMFYNLAVLFTRCVKDNVSPLPFSVSAAAAAAKVGSHLDQEACLRKLLESAADTSCSSSSSSKPIPNTFLTNNFEEGDELVGSVLERACLEVYVNAGREIKISEVYVQQAVKEVVVKLIKSCIRIRNLRFRLFRKGGKKEEGKEEEEEEEKKEGEAIKKDQEIFFTAAAAAQTRNSNQRFKQKMKQKQRQKQLDMLTVKICLLNIALEQATDRVENNQDYISDCCDSHLRLTKKKLNFEDLL
jgi:archaellum component FlaD/FlaE